MAALPALRPIAYVAALNATVQGLIGVVLSILALCVCFCGLGTAPGTLDNDFIQYLTYYFQGEECRGHDYLLYTGVTSPNVLRIWMALSLFFSASMLVSSLVLVVAVAKQWSDEKFQITLVTWLYINFFAAIDDVILGYVFGSDFLTALGSTSQHNNVGPLTLGIVTFLAVRGVYLWLLNVIFIFYLFWGARVLHKFLNEQLPTMDQVPIESWPTLDDFDKSKGMEIVQTPTAVNPRVAERAENRQPVEAWPEHTAMARWPTLNGQAHTIREQQPDRVEGGRERRSKTMREASLRRQEGVDNPAYERESSKYYLRLQSEPGSTQDYDEYQTDTQRRRRVQGSQQSDPPRNQERSRREVARNPSSGQYNQRTSDPWRESQISPPPLQIFLEENGVPIPPVDYPLEEEPQFPPSPRAHRGPQSLQDAILDRTLRLKKVPDELKKGFQK